MTLSFRTISPYRKRHWEGFDATDRITLQPPPCYHTRPYFNDSCYETGSLNSQYLCCNFFMPCPSNTCGVASRCRHEWCSQGQLSHGHLFGTWHVEADAWNSLRMLIAATVSVSEDPPS